MKEATMAPLQPWMRFLLRLAGTYNLLAGLSMICFYHEGYKILGVSKPELILPVQMMGTLVALFGVGYHMVASDPIDNRNILLLGLLSKAIGSVVALAHVVSGTLPVWFAAVVFFADIIYVLPFFIIFQQLKRLART